MCWNPQTQREWQAFCETGISAGMIRESRRQIEAGNYIEANTLEEFMDKILGLDPNDRQATDIDGERTETD